MQGNLNNLSDAVFSVVVVLAVAVFLLATALTRLNAKLLRSHGDVCGGCRAGDR